MEPRRQPHRHRQRRRHRADLGRRHRRQLLPPLAHQSDVHAVAWSPDGNRLVTASGDHTARIWDVSTEAGTLADWHAIADRCGYRLNGDGAVVTRER